MEKSPDAFRTISEVSEWLDTPAHVLRFWESRFTQIKPVKRAGGRRYYRPADMMLLGGIKKLLHDEGMTIRGVQKILRDQGVKHVSALSQALEDGAVFDSVAQVASDADSEAPMLENAEAPTDNVVPLKPADPEHAAPPPLREAAAMTADAALAEPATAPDSPTEPELPLMASAAPLGTDLPAHDLADDALPLGPAPLTARLRNRAIRRHLRENHAAAVASAMPRLKALYARLADAE